MICSCEQTGCDRKNTDWRKRSEQSGRLGWPPCIFNRKRKQWTPDCSHDSLQGSKGESIRTEPQQLGPGPRLSRESKKSSREKAKKAAKTSRLEHVRPCFQDPSSAKASLCHLAMGQKPVPLVNIPILTKKTKMGGAPIPKPWPPCMGLGGGLRSA